MKKEYDYYVLRVMFTMTDTPKKYQKDVDFNTNSSTWVKCSKSTYYRATGHHRIKEITIS